MVLPGIAGRLIGRKPEITIIRDYLDSAIRGTGSILFLSGEAGVGKSRLLSEISSIFAEQASHGLTLRGNCFEGDRGLAFAPILEMLQLLLTNQQSDLGEEFLGSDPSAYLTLLPELAPRLPGTDPLPGTAPEQDKHRIFRAILDSFSTLARTTPVLITLEDLHWSDASSLELIGHLARPIQTMPLLLICTFRTEEESPGLRRVLADIERERCGLELQLDRLQIHEVDLLLRDIFDQTYSIRSDFLNAIYALTGGNPFFIEEVVRSLIAVGDIFRTGSTWSRKDLAQLRIPRTIQDSIARRTENLDADAKHVLELAAVVGQRFDFLLLGSLAIFPDQKLLAVLKKLIEAHLIVEEGSSRFSFQHALIREAIYGSLLKQEQVRWHAQVAELIENLHSESNLQRHAELSYHYHAAERWEKAFEYASAAGEQAQALFEPNAVVDHYSRAIESARKLNHLPVVGLLIQRGQAYETLGEFDAARQDFDTAYENARSNDNPREEWEAMIALGGSWEGLNYDRAGEWFQRAIQLARSLSDPAMLGHSLNRIGTFYTNLELLDHARNAHREALEIFEDLDDEPGVAASIDYLGVVADLAGDLAEMRSRYLQVSEIFERHGDLQRLSSTLASMSVLSGASVFETVSTSLASSHAEVEEWSRRGLQLARETGWRAGEAYARMNLGGLYVCMGRYSDAFRQLDGAVEISREIAHREWLTASLAIIGHLYREILSFDIAIERLGESVELARQSGSRHFYHLNAGFLVDALTDNGELTRAGDVLSTFSLDMPMQAIGQRRLWAARARWNHASADPEATISIIDRLYQTGVDVRTDADIPLLAHIRGLALAALNQIEAAEAAMLHAQAGTRLIDLPGALWRVDLDLMRLYRRLGQPEKQLELVEEARTIIERLGKDIPDEKLRAEFFSTTARMVESAGGQGIVRPATFEDLTQREREVALLVSRGRSNREIATDLFIGERTVETHVGNILSKLRFRSRTQIATWVVDRSEEIRKP